MIFQATKLWASIGATGWWRIFFSAETQRRRDAEEGENIFSQRWNPSPRKFSFPSAPLRLCASAVKFNHLPYVISTLCLLLTIASFAATNPTNGTNTASRNIGIEGSVALTLPRADYKPRPLDDRTELILRIERVTTLASNAHRYEFAYMGLEPGSYKLADFLIRPDGTRPDELGELRVEARAMLPEEHDGKLNNYVPRPFPFVGGYRALLVLLGVAWVGGIGVYVFLSRKKRVFIAPVAVAPGPSLAERLRPLVEEAAAGRLSVEGQAHLERLLMGYWREKLSLSEARLAESVATLKAHAEAGELLRALERWLHRPGGATKEEVTALLQPYRNMPASKPVEVAA